MKVTVVGAGLGGLAASIRLARVGYQVQVREKKGYAGGKITELRLDTARGLFTFDAGPTLITMPQVLEELFAACGERLADHLTLLPVEPSCRYFWSDGVSVDEDVAFWARPEVARYLEHARGIFELSADAYLDRAPAEAWRAAGWELLSQLRHLPKVATRETLAQLNARAFRDPRLRQIFDRFATFNGSSPARALATFAIISYVQARFGAWYVKGGVARLAEALQALAERQGVRFSFGDEVRDLTRLGSGLVVCNADALTAHAQLLHDRARARRLLRPALSSSGLLLWLGVARRTPQLAHHNVFFSDDYAAEHRQIFEQRRLPDQPTIYLSVSARSEPAHAPEGCENWGLMVNAPADRALSTSGYEQIVLERLARFGVELGPGEILVRRRFGPRNFWSRDRAWEGALYGWASHSARAALLRPSLQHPRRPRLFFVGGTVHPGGGVPLALRSGAIVARLIQRRFPPRAVSSPRSLL